MKQLFSKTTLCRAIAADPGGTFSQTVLVLFSDKQNLRPLLKECARLFFGAKEGSRTGDLVEKEWYPDLLIFPEPEKKLSAEHCEKIVEESLLHPVEGEKKLFVLDNFDDATPLLQNKLLKLLEEPPENVYFLLGAESEYAVLPTVLSRVKKFSVPPFAEEEIEGALKRKYQGTEYSKEEFSLAASASGGVFSIAEKLLLGGGEEHRLAQTFLLGENIESFCRGMDKYQNKSEFFAALKSLLRDVIFVRAGEGKFADRREAELSALSREFEAGAAIACMERVFEAEKQVRFNANFSSCLYALALGIKEEKETWKRLS